MTVYDSCGRTTHVTREHPPRAATIRARRVDLQYRKRSMYIAFYPHTSPQQSTPKEHTVLRSLVLTPLYAYFWQFLAAARLQGMCAPFSLLWALAAPVQSRATLPTYIASCATWTITCRVAQGTRSRTQILRQ